MVTLKVNQQHFEIDDAEMPLLWAIRDIIGLKGTKFGCGAAQCGACTVHIDGTAVRSCVTPVSSAEGKSVTTIEGLSETGDHPLQRAWLELNVPQCGYCQAGQIMNVSIIDSSEPPTGVGEPPTPVVAPALTNAIFAATGKRIHDLPLSARGFV